VYATEVEGKNLTLGVSGMLWEGSLVMVDQETGSLWSHLLGACMKGPLVGKELEVIPSLITDWKSWKARNAKGSLAWLPRSAIRYRSGSSRLDAGLGLGLVEEGESRIWDFGFLAAHPVINDKLAGRPLVVFFDLSAEAASIFSRLVDDQVLSFTFSENQCLDNETESSWDLQTGAALSGPMQGRQLTRLPGIISDGAAWETFHPKTTVWLPDEKP